MCSVHADAQVLLTRASWRIVYVCACACACACACGTLLARYTVLCERVVAMLERADQHITTSGLVARFAVHLKAA